MGRNALRCTSGHYSWREVLPESASAPERASTLSSVVPSGAGSPWAAARLACAGGAIFATGTFSSSNLAAQRLAKRSVAEF